MRIGLIIAGLVLIIAGAAAWMGEFEYTKDKEVAKIGSLSAPISSGGGAQSDGARQGRGGDARYSPCG